MKQLVLEAPEVLPQPGSLRQDYWDRTGGCKVDCTSADLTFKLAFDSPFPPNLQTQTGGQRLVALTSMCSSVTAWIHAPLKYGLQVSCTAYSVLENLLLHFHMRSS